MYGLTCPALCGSSGTVRKPKVKSDIGPNAKQRDANAKALATPLYRQRVKPKGTLYKRKPKHMKGAKDGE